MSRLCHQQELWMTVWKCKPCTNMDICAKVLLNCSETSSCLMIVSDWESIWWKYNNSLLHYCSLVCVCVCVCARAHGELGNHNEKSCGQWKPPNFKNKVADEAFINRTGLMALAWGSALAARLFIIEAQNKSPYMALFLLPPVFLSLTLAKTASRIWNQMPPSDMAEKLFQGWFWGTSWFSCLVVIFGQCHLSIAEDQGWCLLAPAKYIRRISVKGLSGMWVNIMRQLQQQ